MAWSDSENIAEKTLTNTSQHFSNRRFGTRLGAFGSGLDKETLALYSVFLWLLTFYRVCVCFVKLNVLNSICI